MLQKCEYLLSGLIKTGKTEKYMICFKHKVEPLCMEQNDVFMGSYSNIYGRSALVQSLDSTGCRQGLYGG